MFMFMEELNCGKILIVDDDREIASLISDALTVKGTNALAFNGEHASLY